MGSSLQRAGDSLLPSVQACTFYQTNPALASFCSSVLVWSFEAREYPIAARSRRGRNHEIKGEINPMFQLGSRCCWREHEPRAPRPAVERGKWCHKHPTAALSTCSSSLLLPQTHSLNLVGFFIVLCLFLKTEKTHNPIRWHQNVSLGHKLLSPTNKRKGQTVWFLGVSSR